MDTPLERQLTRALKVLQRQANEDGVIQGGSAVQTIKRAMQLSLWRARRLNQQLGLLGFRKSTRQGKRHAHYIVTDVTKVTKRDVARLRQLEKTNAEPFAGTEGLLPADDPIAEVIEYVVRLENENAALRRLVDEGASRQAVVCDPRLQELLLRIRATQPGSA